MRFAFALPFARPRKQAFHLFYSVGGKAMRFMSIKKIGAVLAAVLVVACFAFAFTSCSSEEETTTVITTDGAAVKKADCIELIKSYSVEELGLEGTWDDYNFVGHKENGVEVKDGAHDGYYIEVQVGNKVNNEDGTVSIDISGSYFISYDGETVLSYDRTTGVYTPLAEVHDVPASAE